MRAIMSLGTELRDEGMALASDAQERETPGWHARAYGALVELARLRGQIHTDDLADFFTEKPHHFNAWGAVWKQAVKEGVIERTGHVRMSLDPNKHGHAAPVYRSLLRTLTATV
jgi:hypothetical protein